MAKVAVEELSKILVGERIETRRLYEKMLDSQLVKCDRGGIAMRAVSAIDIALWDIMGKACNRPVCELMGKYRNEVPVYYSSGYYPQEWHTQKELLDYIEKEFASAYESGYRSFKMKIGGVAITNDVQRIATARKVIGSESDLMLDATSCYDADTAIALAKKAEQYDITWLEDPVKLDDTRNCAYVAERVSMPIATGEQNHTMAQFVDLIDRKAARIIMADPCFCGGYTAFLDLAGLCAVYNMRITPHIAHDLHIQLALARPEVLNIEYIHTMFLPVQKIMLNPVIIKNGVAQSPNIPGHGILLDEKAIDKYELK
jgi:L-alanine-DL-glutamate epimerase-like enolase superfamily enzyme